MVWWLRTEEFRAPDMTYAKALMFGMLLHPRVGSSSKFSDLPEEIMKVILKSFKYYTCAKQHVDPERRSPRYHETPVEEDSFERRVGFIENTARRHRRGGRSEVTVTSEPHT